MTTVTLGATTVTPLLLLGADWDRPTRSIVHAVLDLAAPLVSLKEAGLRTGTLEFLCEDHAAALELEALHALPGVLVLDDPDLPGANMSYVTSGTIRTQLDPQTRLRAIVTVGFQEVGT